MSGGFAGSITAFRASWHSGLSENPEAPVREEQRTCQGVGPRHAYSSSQGAVHGEDAIQNPGKFVQTNHIGSIGRG